MMRLRRSLGTVLVVGSWVLGPPAAGVESPTVAVLAIEGPIGPANADYVERGLDKALDRGAGLVVLRLDTPGGLADSMRVIIKQILASPVPVVGWVAPAGAHAASAGTYILYACHVAAMAPGTNLGAATPVSIGGGFPAGPEPPADDGGTGASDGAAGGDDGADRTARKDGSGGGGSQRIAGMQDKVVNDAIAYIRSLAELRGRNAEWAERAVREAATLSAVQAREQGVIELIAPDLDDLLAQLDGRVVEVGAGERTLATADATVVTLAPDWRTELLALITNPNVAYILMLVGIYGIILEFYNPGMVFPGVTGAISLLLALYAFQVLPVNYAGLALIGLGLALMVSEMLVPSFGTLGIGGIVAFVVGSIMLMDTDLPGFGISWQVVGGVALTASGLLMLLMVLLGRSQRRPVMTGLEEMAGARALVVDWQGTSGRVRVHGELWRAHGPAGLAPEQLVEVRRVAGLTAEVTPIAEEATP